MKPRVVSENSLGQGKAVLVGWHRTPPRLLHNRYRQTSGDIGKLRTDELLPRRIRRTALDELVENFTTETEQHPVAYANQFLIDHPELDEAQSRADAVLAVKTFHSTLF